MLLLLLLLLLLLWRLLQLLWRLLMLLLLRRRRVRRQLRLRCCSWREAIRGSWWAHAAVFALATAAVTAHVDTRVTAINPAVATTALAVVGDSTVASDRVVRGGADSCAAVGYERL